MFEADSVWEYSMADRLKFGPGAVAELPEEIRALGGESVLLVTDEGVREAGILDSVVEAFPPGLEYDVFDEAESDPPAELFVRAGRYAEEVDPDVIVGLGGGSSIDVGKGASLLSAHGGDVLDYVAPPTGEGQPIPGPTTPYVAVPTTAGTGSESTSVAVVSLPEQKLKVGISDKHLFPDLALVDPSLTVSLPPGPTASSGMDALSHAIEGYTTRRFDAKERPDSPADRPDYGGRNVLSDTLCHEAIDLVADHLRRAVNNGSDLAARRNMSLGATMAALGFANAGLGATHALAYPVAGEHHTPHGLTIALLLPEVMRFNAPSAPERYAEIARLMGTDVSGLDRREAAEKAAVAVEELAADVGIPDGLAAVGVTEDELPRFAEDTMQLQRLLVGNPRRMTAEDAETIFRRAL
ncbi:alcohol dehydrogenase [Halobacteriales archaeon QS_4_69_31]|jgi:alcohol dehydrogenase class IV|nr:MAG: alcohol dehydrogenase [Halobacteriales archaeon QS_4_69_31]